MNCQHAERAILLADTSELSARQIRELDAHVEGCASCARYRQQSRDLMAAARAARAARPATEPGPMVMARIRAAAAAKRPAPPFVLFRRPVVQVMAYAAGLAILAGGWFAFSPGTPASVPFLNDFSAIIHATAETTPETLNTHDDASAGDKQVRALAKELLALEGLMDDQVGGGEIPDAEATSDEELSPTVLRWRSSPVCPRPECG